LRLNSRSEKLLGSFLQYIFSFFFCHSCTPGFSPPPCNHLNVTFSASLRALQFFLLSILSPLPPRPICPTILLTLGPQMNFPNLPCRNSWRKSDGDTLSLGFWFFPYGLFLGTILLHNHSDISQLSMTMFGIPNVHSPPHIVYDPSHELQGLRPVSFFSMRSLHEPRSLLERLLTE